MKWDEDQQILVSFMLKLVEPFNLVFITELNYTLFSLHKILEYNSFEIYGEWSVQGNKETSKQASKQGHTQAYTQAYTHLFVQCNQTSLELT